MGLVDRKARDDRLDLSESCFLRGRGWHWRESTVRSGCLVVRPHGPLDADSYSVGFSRSSGMRSTRGSSQTSRFNDSK
jgi:hypothetical protein